MVGDGILTGNLRNLEKIQPPQYQSNCLAVEGGHTTQLPLPRQTRRLCSRVALLLTHT